MTLHIPSPLDLDLPSKFVHFRPTQWELALSIADSPLRFSLMSSPPGSGKTVSYFTSCILRSKRSLILTPNKPLQLQLMSDFQPCGLTSIIGHSNYPCATPYTSDDDGQDFGCRDRDNCAYWNVDVPRILQSQFVTTNYHHWIAAVKAGDPLRLGHFDTIVLDEAHEADGLLAGQLTLTFDKRSVSQLLDRQTPTHDDSLHTWVLWARDVHTHARKVYAASRKSADRSTLQRLTRLGRDLSRLSHIGKSESWAVERVSTSAGPSVKLSPVWSRPYTETYLFRGAEKVILSSGTLTPLDAEYLGVDKDDLQVIDQDSTFDVDRRPFVYVPTTRVDFGMLEGQKRQLVQRIDRAIDMYGGKYKGLVHTVSYDYRDTVLRLSRHRDTCLLSQERGQVDDCVQAHFESDPPCVLVGPAFAEGFDFIGDRARWQVLLKVPFLNRQGVVADMRCKDDKRYSTHVTSKKVIQAVLRIVRDTSDWGVSLIFDEHWAHFRKNAASYFPMWFRKAWKQADDIPAMREF